MIIQIGLEFYLPLHAVVEALIGAPASMGALYYSEAEVEPSARKKIEDRAGFIREIIGDSGGAFLYGDQVTYSLRAAGDKVVCDCFADVGCSEVEDFFRWGFLASCYFGYACLPEELRYRNKVCAQRGDNSIEGWVGRDTRNIVPGIYWITLISKDMAKLVNINVEKILEVAEESWTVSDRCFVFKMSDGPESWLSRVGDRKLTNESWLFDVSKVRGEIKSATDFLAVMNVLRRWR